MNAAAQATAALDALYAIQTLLDSHKVPAGKVMGIPTFTWELEGLALNEVARVVNETLYEVEG